ncbi:MAG: hypothetical protein N4A64_06855 [Marinisporobacter sp.]|jgi:hypothetical protein|nr:hypothetical protein [Marinisporobacter sp.]
MLIWRGYGILVPIILIGGLFLSSLVMKFLSMFIPLDGASKIWQVALLTITSMIGMTLPGLICIKMGKSLNNKEGKIYIDEETGERISIKPRHTFFFIKMEKWGIIYIVVGALSIATIVIGQFFAR